MYVHAPGSSVSMKCKEKRSTGRASLLVHCHAEVRGGSSSLKMLGALSVMAVAVTNALFRCSCLKLRGRHRRCVCENNCCQHKLHRAIAFRHIALCGRVPNALSPHESLYSFVLSYGPVSSPILLFCNLILPLLTPVGSAKKNNNFDNRLGMRFVRNAIGHRPPPLDDCSSLYE